VKSLVGLLEDLLRDCGRKCDAPVQRDVKTLRARAEHEGDSFITIALPRFCQDFERCLDEGRIGPGLFLSFGKKKSGIPEFLQGFLSNVFDSNGNVSPTASTDCIRCVRQICLFAKKIQRSCSAERELDAVEKYAKCDDDVVFPVSQLERYVRRVAEIILGPMDLSADALSAIMPKHGPGATGEHISGNQKWVFRRWHKRLEQVGFTFLLFGRGTQHPTIEEGVVLPTVVEPEDEEPVRVVLVPKTLTTPRVIAVEPVCMQFAQQGLKDLLVHEVKTSRYTAGHVNFTDQTVNQDLALHGSKFGSFATLDMAEASDRVGVAHVQTVFASKPEFLAWAMASRSTRARLPTGEILALRKFASMGSALCFPVEALMFFISIIASRLVIAGQFPNAQNVYSSGRSVYVYGDDLIVPSDEASAICDHLESLGFKVNRRKSFWTGKFRESCGSDCYGGEQVTPVYLRRDLPTSRKDASGILSAVATYNQLSSAGYWSCAAALREAVEKLIGKLPLVSPDSPAIGWHDHSEVVPPRRWNVHLQRFEYLCWTASHSWVDDPLDGESALAKCFRTIRGTTFDGENSVDPEHLEVSPRPYSLTLKRRWVPGPALAGPGV